MVRPCPCRSTCCSTASAGLFLLLGSNANERLVGRQTSQRHGHRRISRPVDQVLTLLDVIVVAARPVANVAFFSGKSFSALLVKLSTLLRQTMRPLVLNPSIPSLTLPFCPAHRHAVDLRKYQRQIDSVDSFFDLAVFTQKQKFRGAGP